MRKLLITLLLLISQPAFAAGTELSCALEGPNLSYGSPFRVTMTSLGTGLGVDLSVPDSGVSYNLRLVEQYGKSMYFYATKNSSLWLSDMFIFGRRTIYIHAATSDTPAGTQGNVFDQLPGTRFLCTTIAYVR